MTSSAFSAGWLPLAVARAAVVAALPAQLARTGGRHAETPPSHEVFDPQHDEDPFEWLGFTA
jgi:hypothetical protein